jgi:hypothetical protein
MYKIGLICILLYLFCSNSQATTYFKSEAEIVTIASFSLNRPADASSNNSMRIEVPNANWGGSCSNTAYIKGEDKVVISTLLSAWAMGNRIDIEVDDSEAIGNKCKVTFIKMVK